MSSLKDASHVLSIQKLYDHIDLYKIITQLVNRLVI